MKEKFLKFLKNNYKLMIVYTILLLMVFIKLDYQIYAPGGLLDLEDKVEIPNSYKSEGSFNLTYVRGLKGNILFVLLSHIIPSWDLVSLKDTMIEGETQKESEERNKVYLDEVNKNAVIVAYNALNLDLEINKKGIRVIYVYDFAQTNLKTGDIITSINNVKVSSVDDLNNIFSRLSINQKVNLKIIRNGKEKDAYAVIKSKDDKLLIGIAIQNEVEINSNPQVKFNFKSNEFGPSGGLMTALEIYNMLTPEDLTKGYKISGTGTINEDGTVGEIAGIKYKLAGACRKKSDIFICPSNNFEECEHEKEINKYNILLVEGDTFDNVLNKLMELPHYDK